jgi:hypothetical protein
MMKMIVMVIVMMMVMIPVEKGSTITTASDPSAVVLDL